MTGILQTGVYLINDNLKLALPKQGLVPSTEYYIESKYRSVSPIVPYSTLILLAAVDTLVSPYIHKSEKIKIIYH
jgi:hypothetical protein